MTKEELQEIKIVVTETIGSVVNGKIDRLQDAFDEHAQEDRDWKEMAQPAIDLGNNVRGSTRGILWLVTIASTIGGLYLMMREIFKK